MITKRIIPCLDVRNGRVVKGTNFEGIRDVADPVCAVTEDASEVAVPVCVMSADCYEFFCVPISCHVFWTFPAVDADAVLGETFIEAHVELVLVFRGIEPRVHAHHHE